MNCVKCPLFRKFLKECPEKGAVKLNKCLDVKVKRDG